MITPPLGSTLGLQLLASSPDCVKLLDPEGRIQFMNPHGLTLVELSSFADIDAKPWASIWPAESQHLISNAIAEARSGGVARFSAFSATAKGTPKWWDVVVSPVYDDNGTLSWLLAISRDVTQQKHVEESFRIGEQRFRALADHIAQFAWMADATGYIFWYNQRWFDYTGTDIEDMRGWGWKKVHHPAHVDRVTAKFAACIMDGTSWEDTFPIRGVDGRFRWFLSRAMPIRDENGNVVLWCGTNTDITDQRKASQRLSQLARLIELSHEAIIVSDLDDGVMLWNRGCVELFGYTEAEALGTNSFELLRTTHALTRDEMVAVMETDGHWSGEILRHSKDGSDVWTDCRLELIRIGDHRVILETNRDVTERRRADEVRNLLVAELNHRVKNTLAIVQSLASQTARSSDSMSDFVASFNGRIQSLSSAHNILTDKNWSSALVRDLVASQLNVTMGSTERVSISGPDAFLAPQVALQLTLILHELATNAVKHGALSGCDGRVFVDWTITGEVDKKVRLVWTETGDAELTVPERRGFGLNLIERSGKLPHLKTRFEFRSGGIFCEIICDLEEASLAAPLFFDPGKASPRPSTAH